MCTIAWTERKEFRIVLVTGGGGNEENRKGWDGEWGTLVMV